MAAAAHVRTEQGVAAATAPPRTELADLRFQRLLAAEDWARLPPPVRARFCKRLSGGATATYVGEVVEIEVSRLGRVLAQLVRLIGGPLPLVHAPGPSVVTVTEDGGSGGQVWTRLYARPRGFPQVIHSAKRFNGPTGLEEYVGCGIGMALRVSVEDAALVFRSDHYFMALAGLRVRLPSWMEPGKITVIHAEIGEGRFAFMLDVVHPALGQLLRQRAVFREEAR
jgi:hypothetical protein